MPFRIVVVLLGGIVTAIVSLVSPYLGVLAMVILNFARPQDDRPNVTQLHIPYLINVAVLVGTFVRWGAIGPRVLRALKDLKLVLLLFGIMVLSALAAGWTFASRNRLDEFSTVICLCVLTLAWVDNENRLRGYMNTLLLSGGYVASVAIRNPTHISEQIGGSQFERLALGKGALVWGNSNYLALWMVLIIFLTLASIKYYRKLWQRLPLVILLGCAFLTFFRANSRGASLALAIGLFVMWLVSKTKGRDLVLALVLAGVAAAFAPDAYWERLGTIGRYQEDASAMGRLELWQIAVDLIVSNPVAGVGPDNFQLYAPNTPHNAYLQMASEVGIPALLVYVAMLITGLRMAFLAARSLTLQEDGTPTYRSRIALGILCCMIAVTVQGFTTGLAHREMVYVFVTLAIGVNAMADKVLGKETGFSADGMPANSSEMRSFQTPNGADAF
jgi:O-antigen ligase